MLPIYLIDYGPDFFKEDPQSTIEECLNAVDTTGVTWINIIGDGDKGNIDKIGQAFNLHPLLLEDIKTSGERSKLQTYDDNILIVLHLLEFSQGAIKDQQVSIVLGENYLISFFREDSAILGPIRERARRATSRIRKKGADYLAYALIDAVVDNTFEALAAYDDKLEDLEEEVVLNPTPEVLLKIQRAKRELVLIRRTIWPLREVISQFRHIDIITVDQEMPLFLNDLYDHTIQAIEMIEGFRDIIGGMMEIYLSNISQRLNEIMKFLTIVATVFAPMTFLTGLYGMNFEFMPGANHPFGFLIALGAMALTSVIMLWFFYRKRWL
ncbi:MAG: magnesium/cobalt transporter CorA [Chlamydiia bacterium]|nr:magnesium/cobalt transporter CorA [Chlamydiia bacterium]